MVIAVGLAASPVQANLLGGLDVDVSAGKGGLDVDVDVGRNSVDVGVGLGNGGASVGLDAGLGKEGGPGAGPGTPGSPVEEDALRLRARAGTSGGGMPCARDGNETAYNGFLLRDRDGDAFGWVNEATVTPDGKLVSVRLQSSGKTCYKLSNASFQIREGEIWTNADAGKFR